MDKPKLLSPIFLENSLFSDGEESLKLYKGISDKQIEQLLAYTNTDPEIKKFTSDLTRFPDRERFEGWQKGKFIYTLSDVEENLLGITWIEIKKIPFEVQAEGFIKKNYGITIAVRTYGKARGKGYFNPFLNEVLSHFKSSDDYQKINPNGIWVSIAEDNTLSQKAFTKFGFKKIENKIKTGRVLMII